MRYHFARPLPLLLGIIFCCLVLGCSNSEGVDGTGWDDIIVSQDSNGFADSSIDYLPLDDSEYPYAGIPRVVIVTENFRQIRDRETEIPAKLQIWGKDAPESEIMDLTIKGRGNSTWNYPKKPYAIKFNKKQAFLGMPKAKKWVMLANYRDRTLIRNAIAYELGHRTNIGWTPNGKFAEVYLNKKYIGNYFISEKIEINKSRLNFSDSTYLLEFDVHYDEKLKFKTLIKKYPVNIKSPKELTESNFLYIKDFIDSIETCLYKSINCDITSLIDLNSFADYLIIYELAYNTEISHPKSGFMYCEKGSQMKAGPIWDFDWNTFDPLANDFVTNKNYIWYNQLVNRKTFLKKLDSNWNTYKSNFLELTNYIDSLSNYVEKSSIINDKKCNRTNNNSDSFENGSYKDAISLLKQSYLKRFTLLNQEFHYKY